MPRQEQKSSHWHDSDYTLEPHTLRVRANARRRDVDGAQSGTEDNQAADGVPMLLSSVAANKKNYPLKCCVKECGKDLSRGKEYYQRYRVCEEHLRMSSLSVEGEQQRFCQQCGRFHPLADFDNDRRSCRAKLQEHNNRRRKRTTSLDEQADSEAEMKLTRSRRSTVKASNQPAAKSRRGPRRRKAGPFGHLLPDDKLSGSSSSEGAGHKPAQGSDSSTVRAPSSNSDQETGHHAHQTAAQPDMHLSSPPHAQHCKVPCGQDPAGCTALVVHNSPPSHESHANDESTALQDDLLAALARSSSIDEATKQAVHRVKSNIAVNSVGPNSVGPDGVGPNGMGPNGVGPNGVGPGPSTSTAWESPGSLWDLQQPSDLETFYCQLKNSASSSDHQPATEHTQTASLEELERTKRAELLAIQHQLRLSQAQMHAAQQPNKQGYQLPPATLPTLSAAPLPDLLRSHIPGGTPSGGPRLADGHQGLLPPPERLCWEQQQQQPAAQPGLLEEHAALELWHARTKFAAAELPRGSAMADMSQLSAPSQDDNIQLALQMFLEGTGPGSFSSSNTHLSHPASPPRIAAPSHTRMDSQLQALSDRLAVPRGSLQNLQAQNAVSMLHALDNSCLDSALAMQHQTSACSSTRTSAYGKAAVAQEQFGKHQLPGAVVQQRAPEEYSSSASHGVAPHASHSGQTSGMSFSSSGRLEHQLPAEQSRRLTVSGSIASFLSKHNFLSSSSSNSSRVGLKAHSSSPASPGWQNCNSSLASNQGLQPEAGQIPYTMGLSQYSAADWARSIQKSSAQATHAPKAYTMPPLQERSFMHHRLGQGTQPMAPLQPLVEPVLPRQAPPSQPYLVGEHPGQYFGRINLKLSGHTPDSIPHHLLPHLLAMTHEQQLAFVEGHMRPGCVHLVIDIMCHTNPVQWDVAGVAERLMVFDAFWKQGTFFAQLPSGAVQWCDGRIVSVWEANALHMHMPQLRRSQSSSAVACIVSGQPARLPIASQLPPVALQVQTRPHHKGSAKVLARFGGRFVVNTDLLECAVCTSQLSQARLGPLLSTAEGSVLVPALDGVGVLSLEAEHDGFLGAAQPVVVAPDREVQQDVCNLVGLLTQAGAPQARINRLLQDIGMVLQYQEHMLDADDLDSVHGFNDRVPDWESGWAGDLHLTRNDSGSSTLLDSDVSTHCGVLSAAASASGTASHSSAGFQSDDDVHSASGTSLSIQQDRAQARGDYPPLAHPTYIAHIHQASRRLAALCGLLGFAALAEEMSAVAASMQLNDDDAAHTPPSDEQHAGETLHTQSRSAAADNSLPTIDEAALGTTHSSPESSAGMGSGELSTRTSSRAISEFAFDSLDVPDVVETTAAVGQAAVARQTSESGQEVITVVLSEEERQLKDSAKEVHEQQIKGKAGVDQASDIRAGAPPQGKPHAADEPPMSQSPGLDVPLVPGGPPASPTASGSGGSDDLQPLSLANASTFTAQHMLLCAVLVAILAVLCMIGKIWVE